MDNKKPAENEQTAPQVDSKPVSEHKQNSKAPSTGKGWRLLTLLLLLVLITASGGVAWFGNALWLERNTTAQVMAQHTLLIETLQQNIYTASTNQGELTAKFEREFVRFEAEQQKQLSQLKQGRSNKRTTILLDEADFLIRLANQRILVEQRPAGARALLESADEILNTVDDPRLISLRKTLANHILALRQAPTIDREGTFLRISAVGESIMRFRALPIHGLNPGVESTDKTTSPLKADNGSIPLGKEPWYLLLWGNARNTAQSFFAKHFHTRSLERPLIPLMSVTQETQIRHRLLISLGNAQQALLREEPAIYKASLAQVEQDLVRFFTRTNDTATLIEELEQLQSLTVKQTLPDITASLYTLRDYRESARSRSRGAEG